MKKVMLFTLILLVSLTFIFCQSKNDAKTTDKENPESKIEKRDDGKTFAWKENPTVNDIPNQDLKGKLNGKDFTAEYIQFDEDGKDTKIYISNKKPEKLCSKMSFTNDMEKFVIQIPGKLNKGTYTNALTDGKNATLHFLVEKEGKKEISTVYNKKASLALEITEQTENNVKGKIAICIDDDTKSYIAGNFKSDFCESRYIAVEEAPTVNNIKWKMEKYTESEIPTVPLKGQFIGSNFEIKNVTIKDEDDKYTISFANKEAPKACDWIFGADSFKIDSKKPLKKGTFIVNAKDAENKKDWHIWFSYNQNYDRGLMSYNPFWNLALKIDDIDKTNNKVKGSVIAVCDDASKTMFAGAFEADYCQKK